MTFTSLPADELSVPDGLVDPAYLASIDGGATTPAPWYTSTTALELEQRRVFDRSWHFVGVASELPEPGDFVRRRIGSLPIIVVRDKQGEVHAVVNVCPHRGSELVCADDGRLHVIQCPYHAWSFDLDGRFRRAPRQERNAAFSTQGLDLTRLQVATVGELLFVNRDPLAPAFDDVYVGWRDRIDATGDFSALRPADRFEFEVACNWKLLVENNLECYHCPANHPGLKALMDTNEDTDIDPQGPYVVYGPRDAKEGLARDKEAGAYAISDDGRDRQLATHLWPNFFFSLMPGDGIATGSVVLPLGVDRSLYIRRFFFADSVDEATRQDALAFWGQVAAEDRELCESVQRGLSTGAYGQGRLLLPATEAGVHHHQRLLARAMCLDAGAAPLRAADDVDA
jgi:phenylpropionate dioxygenase-like ring-hydroxylating dioxygenase large terminal subunit